MAIRVGLRKKSARGRDVALRRLACAVAAVCAAARGAEWDPVPGNGLVDGGPGAWDLATPNWTVNGGLNNAAWADGDAAVFGGFAGGSVSVSGGVFASSITFDTAGYDLAGPGAITLGPGGLSGGADGLISAAVIAGAGLTKAGPGRVALVNAGNQLAGTILSSGGTLALGDGVFGTPLSFGNNTSFVATGGVIELTGRNFGPGVGVSLASDLTANAGGRIVVGDGLDDAARVQTTFEMDVIADGGTIEFRPRSTALVLDAASSGQITLTNGGMLARSGGDADLVVARDIFEIGAWTLANLAPGTMTVPGAFQDSTAGLTLRADAGVLRYEADALTVGPGGVALDLRGGTIDLAGGSPGKVLAYQPGALVSGFGQVGTSAQNLTHVIPAGGATFRAEGGGTNAVTLSIVGAFDESAGSKAAFVIGDNDGVALVVPNNAPGAPYRVNAVQVEPQSAGSTARLVAREGVVAVNLSAFANANNRVRLEAVSGATLVTDAAQSGGILASGGSFGASVPVLVSGNGTFITHSPTFLVQASESVGGQGTLFGFNGTATTDVTINGILDLAGSFIGSINGGGTGMIRLDAGETLSLFAAADINGMTLAYAGTSGAPAVLEAAANGATVRVRTAAQVSAPFGDFAGTREFRATLGTLQIDAADPATVTVGGVNTLWIDRSADGNANPAELGTLSLNGGAFQVGTAASTTTVGPGALLSGRGTYGHAAPIDTFVNLGTVAATTGPLTISAGTVRGGGAWDPNGQTIFFTGGIADVGAGDQTQLRVSGSNGGRVQLSQANPYTGGTVIDGTGGTGVVSLRVSAAGALGSGSVTLNAGGLLIHSDTALNFSAIPVVVTGTAGSSIQFDRAGTSVTSRTHQIGTISIDGQPLSLAGANSFTLTAAGITVGPGGGALNVSGSSGGATVNANGLTLGGNINLSVAGSTLNVGRMGGTGVATRTFNSGTLVFNAAAVTGFTGGIFTSGGTTNFTASNALSGGTFTFAGGSININAANALNNASGTAQGGSVNLTVANALAGSNIYLTGSTVQANVAGALGSGTVTLAGGRLNLRSDAPAVFGGHLVVGGDVASNLVADRLTANGAGGNHTISSLTFAGQRLNLGAAAGYGLNVSGPITVEGPLFSTFVNDAAQVSTPAMVMNANMLLTGGGATVIGQMGGTGILSKSSSGSITLTGAPLPGFGGQLRLIGGTLNLGTVEGPLAGGTLVVEGGEVNANIAGAMAGSPVLFTSGFINANVTQALSGTSIEMDNGTLVAAAPDVFGNSTFMKRGGNLTATAPDALADTALPISGGILALRNDASTAFGGQVTLLPSTNFVGLSVARATEAGPTGNTLSIDTLTLERDTLNVTGADDYTLAVAGAVTINTPSLLVNATAADVRFTQPLAYNGVLVKEGVRKFTLDGGLTLATPLAVNSGTMTINGVFSGAGVSVGGAQPATLELGGAGVNAPGAINVRRGTLRISKGNPADAVPAAAVITGGTDGDVTIEYAGLRSGTASGMLANGVNVTTTGAARTLTIAAASRDGQRSAALFTGSIARTGANALNVVARADTPADVGGVLSRPASRLTIGTNPAFDLSHGGGIVIARGNVPAGAGPFGPSTNVAGMALSLPDSTIGAMVADGQTAATFSKTVTTPANAPRQRLGAFSNPAGAASQTINIQNAFSWNDPSAPVYAPTVGNSASGVMADATWNGLVVDPGVVMSVNSGAILDNILSASGTTVTAVAPVYVGGGGTVRIASNFNEGSYRNLALARGLAGVVNVLEGTTLDSQTSAHHFDGVELNGGTYRAGNNTQAIGGGFSVQPSPIDPTRTTGTLVTDASLALNGTGLARAFRIGPGATLVKRGAATLAVNSEQAHAAGSTFAAAQGVTNFTTDAGNPGANRLSVSASSGATVNFNVSQHLAQVVVNGGTINLPASGVIGGKVIDATAVLVSGGRLDLANNHMIVDYAVGQSPIQSIRGQLQSGYNAGGARWQGSGIVSSSAAANAKAAIGYGEASQVVGAGGGVFAGEAVDGSSVLLRYTLLGDANLDGVVTFPDLVAVAANYGLSPGSRTWPQGDFDYDGTVTFADLVAVAANFGGVLPAGAEFAPAFEEAWAAALSSVPEPGAALGLFGAALAFRRRRHGR